MPNFIFFLHLPRVRLYARAKIIKNGLQQAGYQSKRIGKTRIRGWIVYERPLDEVKINRNIEGHG